MDWMKSSSNNSIVRTVPLDGVMAAKLSASPSDRIVRALSMIPNANNPTDIDSTINSVRVLLPNRSLKTLYQRALNIIVSFKKTVGHVSNVTTIIREPVMLKA